MRCSQGSVLRFLRCFSLNGVFVAFFLCLPSFTQSYPTLPLFTLFLPLFTPVYSSLPKFTLVYPGLPWSTLVHKLTKVYHSLRKFTLLYLLYLPPAGEPVPDHPGHGEEGERAAAGRPGQHPAVHPLPEHPDHQNNLLEHPDHHRKPDPDRQDHSLWRETCGELRGLMKGKVLRQPQAGGGTQGQVG